MFNKLVCTLPAKKHQILILSSILLFLIFQLSENIKFIAVRKSTIWLQVFHEKFSEFSSENLPVNSFMTSNLRTVAATGYGIGNQMYEIASLYGIAHMLGVQPFIQQKIETQVAQFRKFFPSFKPLLLNISLTRTVSFGSLCCSYEDVDSLRNITDQNITMNGTYFQAHRYFDDIRPQIKEMFAFSSTAKLAARTLIQNITQEFRLRMANQLPAPVTTVCVHIRRGDFVNDPRLLETKAEFTVEAVSWLRRKAHANGLEALFILLGNDRPWAERLFPNDLNIFIPPSPAEKTVDLALMARECDVILLTASGSTFGFWGAYLSEKATVYYNIEYTKNIHSWYGNQFKPRDVFLNKWTALKF